MTLKFHEEEAEQRHGQGKTQKKDHKEKTDDPGKGHQSTSLSYLRIDTFGKLEVFLRPLDGNLFL